MTDLAAIAATPPAQAAAGYITAFYEIAQMLGIGARIGSPAEVWETEMKPKLAALLSAAQPEGDDA